MAKNTFDWQHDKRPQGFDQATFEDWDEVAQFVPQVLENAKQSCIPLFCERATTIYGMMADQSIEARKSAILLARHERLTKLVDLWQASNIFDFYLLKYPAWLLSEWLHRKAERKQGHV